MRSFALAVICALLAVPAFAEEKTPVAIVGIDDKCPDGYSTVLALKDAENSFKVCARVTQGSTSGSFICPNNVCGFSPYLNLK